MVLNLNGNTVFVPIFNKILLSFFVAAWRNIAAFKVSHATRGVLCRFPYFCKKIHLESLIKI
jgi:hypothetical protein